MKTTPQAQPPTVEQFGAFNEAFDFINERLFGSKLGPALLTIARRGRSKGALSPRNGVNRVGGVHEIAISPDLIGDGIDSTMATLIGLMARQLRWQEAIEAGDEKAAATAARGYHDNRLIEIILEAARCPGARTVRPQGRLAPGP